MVNSSSGCRVLTLRRVTGKELAKGNRVDQAANLQEAAEFYAQAREGENCKYFRGRGSRSGAKNSGRTALAVKIGKLRAVDVSGLGRPVSGLTVPSWMLPNLRLTASEDIKPIWPVVRVKKRAS